VAERRRSTRTDPFVAAFVAFLLFLEQLLEPLHQLLEPAHRLDLCLFLGRQVALEPLFEPFGRQGECGIGQLLDAAKIGAERLVELVEVALVLDQREPGEVIEIVERGADDTFAQRAEQRQVLLDRHRQLCGAQRVEEVDQHDAVLCLARRGRGNRGPTPARRAVSR
jgi:hypothetical protein